MKKINLTTKKFWFTIGFTILIGLVYNPHFAHADITTNLKTWYKFDEGSGTTAIDSGTNAINGTLTNGPVYTTGKIGPYALSTGPFTSQNYVTAGNINNVTTGSFTISAWAQFNTQPSGNNFPGIIAKSATNSGLGYMFLVLQSPQNVCFQISDGTNVESDCSPLAYDDGLWHQYVGVADRVAQTEYLYIDGNLIGTLPISSVGSLSNTRDFVVGYRGDGAGIPANFFSGNIDDTRFYNRALTASDVSQLYKYPAVARLNMIMSMNY